jgi:hypothetical protein
MLEFLVLWQLGKSIAAKARKKGRSAARAVSLLLGLWFVGEAIGAAVTCGIFAALIGSDRAERAVIPIYMVAIAGASCGAYLAFKTATREVPLGDEPAATS